MIEIIVFAEFCSNLTRLDRNSACSKILFETKHRQYLRLLPRVEAGPDLPGGQPRGHDAGRTSVSLGQARREAQRSHLRLVGSVGLGLEELAQHEPAHQQEPVVVR